MKNNEQSNSAAEQELKQIESEFYRAYLSMQPQQRRETAIFERILADDYFYIADNDIRQSKTDRLAFLRDLRRTVDKNNQTDTQFRLIGDNTALVHTHATFEGTFNGETVRGNTRDVHVYEKRGGRWQQVADFSITLKNNSL